MEKGAFEDSSRTSFDGRGGDRSASAAISFGAAGALGYGVRNPSHSFGTPQSFTGAGGISQFGVGSWPGEQAPSTTSTIMGGSFNAAGSDNVSTLFDSRDVVDATAPVIEDSRTTVAALEDTSLTRPIPEPSMYVLILSAFALLGVVYRRKSVPRSAL